MFPDNGLEDLVLRYLTRYFIELSIGVRWCLSDRMASGAISRCAMMIQRAQYISTSAILAR